MDLWKFRTHGEIDKGRVYMEEKGGSTPDLSSRKLLVIVIEGNSDAIPVSWWKVTSKISNKLPWWEYPFSITWNCHPRCRFLFGCLKKFKMEAKNEALSKVFRKFCLNPVKNDLVLQWISVVPEYRTLEEDAEDLEEYIKEESKNRPEKPINSKCKKILSASLFLHIISSGW